MAYGIEFTGDGSVVSGCGSRKWLWCKVFVYESAATLE
jgi:hypothetical protein